MKLEIGNHQSLQVKQKNTKSSFKDLKKRFENLLILLQLVKKFSYGVITNYFVQDPDFYEFLKEHDKELLQFNDEDIDVSMQNHLFIVLNLLIPLMCILRNG